MQTVEIPEGVEVAVKGNQIIVKKGELELSREFPLRTLSIQIKDSSAEISSFTETAKSRAMIGTFRAHINNMIKGVQEKFVYKLKICSVHFPMSVKQAGDEIQIQNFLGEKKAKKVKLVAGVEVKVEGDVITVSAADKETAGMVASRLEQATRLRKKDRRIFQDGIFMIDKAGREING